MKSEPLNIADKTFLINRLIQQAPRSTLIREFFKNAEENAALAPSEQGIIKIYPTEIDGVRKLTFWNTGIGMSESELRSATDLSSSINKKMALDGNFGIGAKVSGLAVSPNGIRYRSCKDGSISEVTIGYDPDADTYVRFAVEFEDGTSDTIIDVTETAISEGQNINFDWTEVVLMGEADDHDTVSEPLKRGETLDRSYVSSEIFRRFARFPKNIDLMIDVAMTKGGGKEETGRYRRVRPLEDILDELPRHETCCDPETGVEVRYVHDPKHPTSSHTESARKVPAVASTTFCALVHKGERYDYKNKKAWSAAAPNFGIPFGSKVLTVEILLPDNYATPNQYRDGLTDPTDRSRIEAVDFDHIVRALMPEWVKEIIKSESPQSTENLDDLQAELQKLLDEFRVPTPALRELRTETAAPTEPNETGTDASEPASEDFAEFPGEIQFGIKPHDDSEDTGQRAQNKKVRTAPKGAKTSKALQALERVPKIIILVEPEEVADKELKGRAGRYYKDSQEIFVNGLYPVVDRMATELEAELADLGEPEERRAIIVKAARRSTAFRVGKAVCFAISKRLSDDWNADDLDKATSPESLSLSADDFRQGIKEAKRYVKINLKVLDVEKLESM